MRVKSLTIALVALAVGAVPAVAARESALRSVPSSVARTVVGPVTPAPAPAVVVRPSAVWIPAPATGIKWTARPSKSSRPSKPSKPSRSSRSSRLHR